MSEPLPSKTGTTYYGQPSISTNAWNSTPDNCLETIAGADDGDYGYVDQNVETDYGAGFVMEDMPTDFGTMTTCYSRIRYGWDTYSTSNEVWNSLGMRVVTTTGTVLAAADAGGGFQEVATGITTTSPTNSSNVAFGYVNTGANKAAWNDAIMEIQILRQKIKGGGADQQRVYAAEINGTYEIGAAVTTKIYLIT
jgi:hypothetical protein